MTSIRDAFIDADPTVALQRRLLADIAAADAAANDDANAAIFWAGPRRFALPTRHIEQVAIVPELVPVPGAAPHIRGVAAVKGEVYEVLDVALFTKSAPTSATSPDARLICLVQDQASLLALLVDRVEPFVTLSSLGSFHRSGHEPAWIQGRNASDVPLLNARNLRAA